MEKRSDDNIVTTEILINGITDRLEQVSLPFYSQPDNPNSITEGLWEGDHDVRFRVISQTKIDTFSITFYNVGSCYSVNIKVYPLTFYGNSFNINLDWPGYSAGYLEGTFVPEGDSISGTFDYTNYSCGGSVSGSWYATPSIEQPEWNIVWEEKFDDYYPPPDWVVIDNDGSGSQYLLIQRIDFSSGEHVYPQAGTSFWWSGFINANNDGLIDEWLITPMLDMITEESVLIIWAGAVGDYNYADSLKIWISDTDNSLSSFDDMIAYFKVDGPIGSWHEYVFDISDYAGKQIYVAANYYILHGGAGGYDSDNLWVDHFCIAEPVIVSVDEEAHPPAEFTLGQNYPNPFNPTTKISWQSPVGSWQTLKVYDILGNEVATLVDEYKPAGSYEVEFDSHSDEGQNLPSGIYFYQLKAGGFSQTRKMILIK